MAILPGLGVNYKAVQANWKSDADFFDSIALHYIRPQANPIPIPWDSTTDALWRNCCIYFKQRGFWVERSMARNGTLTAANWQDYHDAVVAEATYLQANNIHFDLFSVGNELENGVDGTTLTVDQVRPLIRQLVVDVQAVYDNPVGYDIGYGNAGNYAAWNAEGKGTMNMIALHPYGLASGQFTFVKYDVYRQAVLDFAATFGQSGIITEFNLDDNATRFASLKKEALDFGMREMASTIKEAWPQGTIAIVFQWVGYLNSDNQFAMKNMDGSLNTAWDILLNNNGRRTFIS